MTNQGETEFGKLMVSEKTLELPCNLRLVCDWGGTEEACCLECAKLPDCLKICWRAEAQLMTGEKCRWREDRARNQRDLGMMEVQRYAGGR